MGGYAISAERDIYVFPKPRRQSDVPPPPKVGYALCGVRIIEVFGKIEAENFTKTYCHIGVARKIKIDLKGKENESEPRAEC